MKIVSTGDLLTSTRSSSSWSLEGGVFTGHNGYGRGGGGKGGGGEEEEDEKEEHEKEEEAEEERKEKYDT